MIFSVIVPVYNCEGYVENCIKSIQAQSFSDWELILVNDGSKDNSLAICQNYAEKDARIRVIDQPNAGASVARNRGLSEACGEYVIFSDADDYLSPDALEVISNELSHSNYDLVFFGYYDAKQDETITPVRQHQLQRVEFHSNETFKQCYIALDNIAFTHPVWNKTYKRAFLQRIQASFPNGVMVSEDYLFNLSVYEHAEDVLIMENCCYYYIQRPHSITTRFDYRKLENIELVFLTSLNFFKHWNSDVCNRVCNNYIRDISVFINNMFNRDTVLTSAEKYKLIKDILKRDSIERCLSQIRFEGMRNRLVGICLKLRCAFLLFCMGWIARRIL